MVPTDAKNDAQQADENEPVLTNLLFQTRKSKAERCDNSAVETQEKVICRKSSLTRLVSHLDEKLVLLKQMASRRSWFIALAA
jgi:hypothetical protein